MFQWKISLESDFNISRFQDFKLKNKLELVNFQKIMFQYQNIAIGQSDSIFKQKIIVFQWKVYLERDFNIKKIETESLKSKQLFPWKVYSGLDFKTISI
jgi:hypothetical protein